MSLPPLNCGGCRKCCHEAVPLFTGDNPALWKTRLVDGKRVLATKKNGDCIYLGENGCKIHNGPRPIACQTFDCRLYAQRVMADPTRAHRLSRPAVQEGIRRLHEALA